MQPVKRIEERGMRIKEARIILYESLHFIFEGLEGDIVGGCAVVVIGFEECFGIVEAMAVGGQL